MLKRITIGAIVLLLMAILVLAYAVSEEARMATKETNFAGRSVENGASIFAEACTGCHGIRGEGIPGVAPALNVASFFTTRLDEVGYTGSLESYIESTVAAGRPVGSGQYSAVMPTWGQEYGGPFRPDQVGDVTAFILNWEEEALGGGVTTAPQPTPTPLPADAPPEQLGRLVYEQQGCAGCHGEPGEAGIVGPNLGGIATRGAERKPPQSAEDYIRESIVNPAAYLVPECPTGPCANVMPANYGNTLSDDQLNNLITYLLTME